MKAKERPLEARNVQKGIPKGLESPIYREPKP